MSFLTQSVVVPVWVFVLLIAALLPVLVHLLGLIYRFRRGEIIKEEQSDMVVWKIRSQKPGAIPRKRTADASREKEHEEKTDLVQVLKILLKEGDKGIRMQSIADKMETTLSKAQHAMVKLVEKKMVEEVVGVSGTKYYLTQSGREYCRSKSKQV